MLERVPHAAPGRLEPPRYDPGDGFLVRHLADPILKAATGGAYFLWRRSRCRGRVRRSRSTRCPLRPVYADLALMEEALRDSGLGWATIRPGKLAGKPLTGTYRTALGNVRRGLTISRADVAHCMLRVIGQQEMFKQTVGIARWRPRGGRIRTNRTAPMIVEVSGHIRHISLHDHGAVVLAGSVVLACCAADVLTGVTRLTRLTMLMRPRGDGPRGDAAPRATRPPGRRGPPATRPPGDAA